jgi:pyruvate formate-lyase/glycerol dehydratase family glycyl radical enzyme
MANVPSVLSSVPEPAPDGARADSTPALPRLAQLREDLLDAPYTLCTQKAELLTEFFRARTKRGAMAGLARLHFAVARRALERSLAEGLPQKRWQLGINNALQRLYAWREAAVREEALVVQYARALAYILERAPLRIYEHELVVGNPSSQRIGAPIHPDLGGLLMLPELEGLASRAVNPLCTTPEQLRRLEDEILPFWFSRSVQSRAPLLSSDPELPNKLMRGREFILTQFAGISHVTPDYPAVLSRGFEGLLAEAEQRALDARDPSQEAFCEAAAITARAASNFGARWSAHCATEAARETRSERAAELRELAELLSRVPAKPARSFHEALQSLYLSHVIVHQESFQHGVSFGRIDQYLLPYYRADLAAGRITPERAVELLGCLLGKAAELLPLFNAMATEYFSGLSSASGITLGGCDADGRDASNELSFLVLEAYDQMRLRQPNLHLRVHPESDPNLLARAHEIAKRGGGMPAFFNDEAVVPAIESLGVTRADARDYSIVGCVEWGVPYRSFPAAGACFLSLPAALDRALHAGHYAGEGESTPGFGSTEEIFAALCREIGQSVDAAVAGNDAIERAHALHRPTPLLSLLVDGCLASGREVNAGGARYNSSGVQGVGVADVADSLAAIERLVFEQGELGLGELMRAVDVDFDPARFENAPELHSQLRCRAPKYGQDGGLAERWARRVAGAFCEAVRRHENPRGGPYAPGFWTMTTHVGFGRRLGALPSGRRAGEPLSDGISPVNGSDSEGPTASLSAALGVGAQATGNGLCLNEKLDPWYLRGAAGTRLMSDLTRGYFAAGGMQLQYNVVDGAVLLDAKRHPGRHRDLVVRISGYSAYFNDLTEEMKDDIIARTLHGREQAS